MPFYPGPGIGGHCIGIDPHLPGSGRCGLTGYDSRFIQLADEINRSMPARTVEMVVEALNARRKPLNGSKVLALGVAYKRGVGDTRESPAIEVIGRLRERGAEVAYADPYVPAVSVDGQSMKAVELTEEEMASSDCVLILTDHAEFEYGRILNLAALVVDMRNATQGLLSPNDQVVTL